MSLIAPAPRSGQLPRKETQHYDMVRPAPFLPSTIVESRSFDHLVNLSRELTAPAGEIIARPYKDHYEVLFGIDYLKAYQQVAPKGQVLLSVYHYSDHEAVKVALDMAAAHYGLNVIELSESYRKALSHFCWKNADLARALDLKRSTITNRLKLTNLSQDVKDLVCRSALSIEHAKILSRLNLKDQNKFAGQAVLHGWDTRTLYKKIHPQWQPKGMSVIFEPEPLEKNGDHIRLEQTLSEYLGSPIKIDTDKNHKGVLRVQFYTLGELVGIVQKLESTSSEELRWKGEIHLTVDGLDHLDGILGDFYPKEEF
jgi:ParB-like chromosome segregation protein Spo0J